MVRREGDAVRVFTRRGFDWSERYPLIAAASGRLKAASFTIDGEGVVCRPDGVADFAMLQSRQHDRAACLQLPQGAGLAGEHRHVMPGVVDRVAAAE